MSKTGKAIETESSIRGEGVGTGTRRSQTVTGRMREHGGQGVGTNRLPGMEEQPAGRRQVSRAIAFIGCAFEYSLKKRWSIYLLYSPSNGPSLMPLK